MPAMFGMDLPLVRFGRWIGAGFLLLGAGMTAVILGGNVMKARASVQWPTVTGTINDVHLEPATDRDDAYNVVISYGYATPDGSGHAGTKVRMGYGPYGKNQAEAMIAGYAPGQKRAVYYDPDDPEQAVLVPGAGNGEYAQLIVPPLFLLAGVAVIVWLIKTRPRNEDRLFPDEPPPLPR
jgi:hypothetical protein